MPLLTRDEARFNRMVELRRSGMTLQQIAAEYSLTRQRVYQILTAHLRKKAKDTPEDKP